MANINVSYDELEQTATRIAAGREEIGAKLGELQALASTLVASGFVTDRSSRAFQQSYEELTGGARRTIAGLDGLASYLRQAASTLADVDAQLAARLTH